MRIHDNAYMEGWNAASAGCLAHQNPYPDVSPLQVDDGHFVMSDIRQFMFAQGNSYSAFIPGWPKHMLWLSGYADYMASPNNCEAQRRYRLFHMSGDKDCFVHGAADVGGIAFHYVYDDFSRVEFKGDVLFVINRAGEQIIQLELA